MLIRKARATLPVLIPFSSSLRIRCTSVVIDMSSYNPCVTHSLYMSCLLYARVQFQLFFFLGFFQREKHMLILTVHSVS